MQRCGVEGPTLSDDLPTCDSSLTATLSFRCAYKKEPGAAQKLGPTRQIPVLIPAKRTEQEQEQEPTGMGG